MKNKEPSVRSALTVSLISGAAGFLNGVWVILAGTSYFYVLSPYTLILGAMFLVFPGQVVDDAENFLFRSGVQFILAPLLGALLGVLIGYTASRSRGKSAKSLLMKNGAASGGMGGFLSLGIIYLNIYAS
jgi:hypothetical protein